MIDMITALYRRIANAFLGTILSFHRANSQQRASLSTNSEQALYALLIVRVHEGGVPQAQLGFLALAAHHVRSFRLKTLDLTGTSTLETLLGTGVCFHLRHCEYL